MAEALGTSAQILQTVWLENKGLGWSRILCTECSSDEVSQHGWIISALLGGFAHPN